MHLWLRLCSSAWGCGTRSNSTPCHELSVARRKQDRLLLTRQGNDAESSDYMFKTEMEHIEFMTCGICQTESARFGEAILLDKYRVQYFHCPKCGFIQTEKPYWLNEAYAEALVAANVGVMQRNLQTSAVTSAVISLALS